MLFPSSKQLDVLLASGGVRYAITELEKSASEGPTKENQKVVEYIFQNWGKTPPSYCIFDFRPSYEVPTMYPNEVATKLADIAVQSNDAKLWVRTIGMCGLKDGVDLGRFGLNRITAGWERFQLEEVGTAYVPLSKGLCIMGTQTGLTSRLGRIVDDLERIEDTLAVLRALGSTEDVSLPETRGNQWLSEHLDRMFTKEPEESDLPSIMEVVFSRGLHYAARVYGVRSALDVPTLKASSRIMPSFLSQLLGASFWATVVENLETSKDRLLVLPPSQGQRLSNEELFAAILEDAQRAAVVDPLSPLTDSGDDDSE